ncbi:hypothetical protein [Halalkalibacterium halodurans]|uniref:hypothetical protein n=1 Tax=Halalkalibacterium halodurans TaxID=86665 RepID=UPI002AAA5777|nr:hypothetical protein [Halalkalibacterium halodurans]MDY7223989.1 hypothetical protein [Halalkalibacterium halodurans]MDY7243210.1 hypothetical protein [Halalkalibacterium halodurans]
MNNHIKTVHYLMGLGDNEEVELLSNVLMEAMPYIGRFLTSFKFYRLEKRLKKHAKTIDEMKARVELIDDIQFTELLKEFLFPMVLQGLLDEDEDNKVGYFLDGFSHTIDSKISDKAKILKFYDILKELRFIEIEYLISFSREYKRYKSEYIFENKKMLDDHFENGDFKMIRPAIENKLENLGMIDTGRLLSYEQIMGIMNDERRNRKRHLALPDYTTKTALTVFGNEFLNFYNLLDKYK